MSQRNLCDQHDLMMIMIMAMWMMIMFDDGNVKGNVDDDNV